MNSSRSLLAVLLVGCASGDGTQISQLGGKDSAPLADTPSDALVRDILPTSVIVEYTEDGRRMTSASRGEDTERVIGNNDLIPVIKNGQNVPQQYRGYIDAIGIVSMGCTATHVGNGIVITSGTCFGAGEWEQRDVPCDATVQWGVRKDRGSYLTSNCTRILAMRQSADVDYAIFRVDLQPQAAVPVNVNSRQTINSTITIFSHPNLRPLEWSQNCTLRPGTDGGWGAGEFSHACDTEGGSSGAAVLTSGGSVAIGIHNGGNGNWNYATYLADTPLRQWVNGGDDNGGGNGGGNNGDNRPTNFKFTNFGNNQNIELVRIGNPGETVSFQIKSDTEAGYDFVTVVDANGNSWQQSGQKSRVFGNANTGLPAPISVRFSSDGSVLSKSVEVLEIRYGL